MLTTTTSSIDHRERELIACEHLVSRLRARQLELLRSLEADQVTQMDGSRTMADWTAARLDLSHDTARSLVAAASILAEQPSVSAELGEGAVSFDRAVATAALAGAGASRGDIDESRGRDIAGVRRMATRLRRLDRLSEARAYRERFLAIQPSLDESHYRLWGRLPGVEGRIVEEALLRRADEFPEPGDRCRAARSQRMADALVSVSQDSLDPVEAGTGGINGAEPIVSIFIDGAAAGRSGGEAGGEIANGPRVGPATLGRMLCNGRVELVGLDGLGRVHSTDAARSVPPAVRRFVLARDGGCVIEGCSSRYRLQVHHVRFRSEGGDHHPSNLVSLCWYHHHVAIHGEGYRLDPNSPPGRRRLLPPVRAGPVAVG